MYKKNYQDLFKKLRMIQAILVLSSWFRLVSVDIYNNCCYLIHYMPGKKCIYIDYKFLHTQGLFHYMHGNCTYINQKC